MTNLPLILFIIYIVGVYISFLIIYIPGNNLDFPIKMSIIFFWFLWLPVVLVKASWGSLKLIIRYIQGKSL